MANGAVVGWLDHGDTRGAFTACLVALTAYSTVNGHLDAAPARLEWGPLLDVGRDRLVEKFLTQTDADWLLMVDSDMAFEPDALGLLLDRAKSTKTLLDTPAIVSGLAYSSTIETGQYPAMYKVNDDGYPQAFYDWRKGDVVDVDATGAACLLVHREVFMTMPHAFDRTERIDGRLLGEDMAFGLKARKLGHRIVVDTNVEFRHIKYGFLDHDSMVRQDQARDAVKAQEQAEREAKAERDKMREQQGGAYEVKGALRAVD